MSAVVKPDTIFLESNLNTSFKMEQRFSPRGITLCSKEQVFTLKFVGTLYKYKKLINHKTAMLKIERNNIANLYHSSALEII